MKSLPTQDRALRKRSALLTAAKAEFSDSGFETATAKSIAARAGVATGTFYQYFENKNDILCVLAADRFSQLHDNIDIFKPGAIDPADATSADAVMSLFSEVLLFVYNFHEQDPELHQVLEQRRSVDPELSAILAEGEAVLQERVLRFVQSFNLPQAELVAQNLFAMAEGLVHRHVFAHSPSATSFDKHQVVSVGAAMLAAYFQSPN
ncbi:MAG: TetR/AcrR family transcriptional regulator [Pseudomonadota bacterium]